MSKEPNLAGGKGLTYAESFTSGSATTKVAEEIMKNMFFYTWNKNSFCFPGIHCYAT